jgi:K(+)-stimulated pyrophosphate-energized sodium pump
VGPTADGFETYGVTGVALITFILLAIPPEHFLPAGQTLHTASAAAIAKATALANTIQVQLLVWIFVMRIIMLVASAAAYFINGFFAKAKYGKADDMNFEAPLTSLVWITSFVSIGLTYLASWLIIPDLGGDTTQWWKLATIITCGTLAGAIIPELVKVFTSVD